MPSIEIKRQLEHGVRGLVKVRSSKSASWSITSSLVATQGGRRLTRMRNNDNDRYTTGDACALLKLTNEAEQESSTERRSMMNLRS
jgi:hypothetical protein